MSKQTATLKTQPRNGTGSRAARHDRDAGRIPVNIYGHGEVNQNLAIDAHELDLALHTASHVFTLSIDGAEQPCLVKEVQYDTWGLRVLHVDFARVSLTEEVEVEVALEFTGIAKGLAAGGQLVVQHPELWVRCPANLIPDVLVVDISSLELGHAIHAGEIALPAGVSLDTEKLEPTDPVVSVLAPKVEEVEPAEGAEGEAAEPEIVGGAKPEADGATETKGEKADD